MSLFWLTGQNKILRMPLAAGFHSRDKDVKQCMKEIMSRYML
jgi:hypothetical protein